MALASKLKTQVPPESFLKALEKIHEKGFTHLKVELEARLGRGQSLNEPCSSCRNSGWLYCETCNNSGYTLSEAREPVECLDCHGDGHNECRRCNGRGYIRGGYSDKWCQQFILKHVSKETAKAIVFGEFYWDGSVDSEYTFTFPTLDGPIALDVIQAFNKLGSEIGNGLDIDNAGLHISVLPSGVYPCRSGLLNRGYMENFRREVAKLLPALYFLGTHTPYTRGLGYRKPYVSSGEKYSAIYTHGDTAIEFRLFDPCFDKPEAFYDKVEVIASTLKYYSDAKVKAKYEKFNMYDLTQLSELYSSMENYNALLQTVKEVKPSKSFTSIKAERKFSISKAKIIAALKSEKSKYEANKENKYKAEVKSWEQSFSRLTNYVLNDFLNSSFAGRHAVLSDWMSRQNITDETLRSSPSLVRQMIIENSLIFGISPEPPASPDRETFEQYKSSRTMRPAYVVTPNLTLDEESESEDYYDDED